MEENEISPFFTIKKIREGDSIQLDQKYIKVRSNTDKVIAIHYKAPIERTIELEMFFEDYNPIERLNYNIGDTGWVGANFRGLIDGKDKSLPVDYDYKILLLEEYKCLSKVELKHVKRSSKFRPNYTIAK
ncbi:hypothetical protein mru_1097 [Methanobrevibacter ruminantium M1]|uniref:Uncharacterized protein n=1 Tax=Methanobrevibacter ruminantium (strain ATCC 35063 / DSM 1093 / JCM 13430 / OCM 146 / M1) TaxID=634498 RepID=D3E337_METRM|nr:hypothetical protein [Methanobrevibacter ruminantium]ADC46948.1 hypothetical protein mru_1097 [Methanobrevibacter ruminantium M1]